MLDKRQNFVKKPMRSHNDLCESDKMTICLTWTFYRRLHESEENPSNHQKLSY